MARTRLSDEEIAKRVDERGEWTRDGDALARTWRFKDYAHAVMFVNAVAQVAEALDHHPDVTLGYGRVHVSISTHDAGGITETDFRFVDAVDALPLSAHVKPSA